MLGHFLQHVKNCGAPGGVDGAGECSLDAVARSSQALTKGRCFFQWKGRAARIAIDSGGHVNYIYLSAHLIENQALLSHSTRSHQRRI